MLFLLRLLYGLLRGKKYRAARRAKRRKPFDPANPPRPMRWRPRVRIYGLLSGAVGGLGTVVLIQQYGIRPLGRVLTLQGLLGGTSSGIVFPSAIYAVVVVLYNRKLRRLLGRRAAPLVSPAAASVGAVRIGLAIVAGAAVSVAILLFAAAPAGADLRGPCTAVFNGRDVRSLPLDPAAAVPMTVDGRFHAVMYSRSDVISMRVGVRYAGFAITVLSSEDSGELFNEDAGGGGMATSWAIRDLAWMGGGMYEFWGFAETISGARCEGAFLFDVEGDPLDTVAGKVAAGAAAVGALGGIAVIGGSASGGLRTLDGLPDDVPELADDYVPPGSPHPPLLDEHGEPVELDGAGNAFTWDGDGWRWMPRDEAEGLIDGQRSADAARWAEQAGRDASLPEVMDDWLENRVATNEVEARAERETNQRFAEAWERYQRTSDAAINQNLAEVVARLDDEETLFDANGRIDVDRVNRLAEITRDQWLRDQAAPDAVYSETGEMLIALDQTVQSTPARIAAALATGGTSEIYYQGRDVVTAIKTAAEQSTEWVADPQTGQWNPPHDFGVADGLQIAAGRVLSENIPGVNTLQTLTDPNATWTDVGAAAALDTVGVYLASDELGEAIDQVRGSAGRLGIGSGVRLDAPDIPTIRAGAGEMITPPPYTDRFLPQFRETSGLRQLPVGEAVPSDMIHHTGYTAAQIEDASNFASARSVTVEARSVNMDTMHMIRDGSAVPKRADIKPNTLTIDDYYLGACELDEIGQVGHYDPSTVVPRPVPADVPADFADRLAQRSTSRAESFATHQADIQQLVDSGQAQMRGSVVTNADGIPFAGDVDAVRFRDAATGEVIDSGPRYEALRDEWMSLQNLGQHGAEHNMVSDIVDKHLSSVPVGTPVPASEFVAAQREAFEGAEELQRALIARRATGREVVLAIGGDGVVRIADPVLQSELNLLGGTT